MQVSILRIIIPVGIGVATLFVSCQSVSKNNPDTQQNLATAAMNFQEEKDNADAERIRIESISALEMFRTDAEIKIRSNEIMIAKLHSSRKKTTNRKNVAYHNALNILQQKNAALLVKVQTFDATKNSLESFKMEFWTDVVKLETAIANMEKGSNK